MSTVIATSLIEKLKEIQAREGLSDYKFADKLGISHQLWQMTRTGKREIGLTILQATMKAYPGLSGDVLVFLSSDVELSSHVGDLSTIPSQPSQNGKLAHFRAWLKRFIPWIKPSISTQATKSKSRG